jgi:hypothetical protein
MASETICCSAELTVDRPRGPTLALFTAEGERAWVPGWDPAFPAPERTEGPGAVFVTAHAEQTTTWVMVDQGDHGVRYARFTPGDTAGTVAVTVIASEPTSTRVRVSYDLTALSPDGAQRLTAFADGFAASISDWEAAIAAVGDELSGSPPSHTP